MLDNDSQLNTTEHRWLLIRLLGRMTIYYFLVTCVVFFALWVRPGLVNDLPLGGLGQFSNMQDSAVYELEESLLNSDGDELDEIAEETQQKREANGPVWYKNARSLFYAMFCTLILMIPVSWVYKSIHEGSVYDHSIDETSLVLPAVVAGIVTVVQHSLALAFSLAGIVAGVRFRRALSDTFDTLFIFVAIGVGIAAGVASVEIAVVITVFFNYTTLFICAFGDGLESQFLAQKKSRREERKLNQQAIIQSSRESLIPPTDKPDEP